MRAFEVYLNEERLCVAGVGEDGVLNTMIDHIIGNNRNDLFMRTGGLLTQTMEHVMWATRDLKVGDEIRVRIVETDAVDPPLTRSRAPEE